MNRASQDLLQDLKPFRAEIEALVRKLEAHPNELVKHFGAVYRQVWNIAVQGHFERVYLQFAKWVEITHYLRVRGAHFINARQLPDDLDELAHYFGVHLEDY